MNVIACENLTKRQGKENTLHDLSFTLKDKSITGLIGRNGAGKTTLLKILAGLWRETSGEVSVFSEKPFNSMLVSANSIYIDDQMAFPTALTLSELLKEGERFYGNWNMKLAERLFEYFSFHPNQIHNTLSKGKKSTFNMIVGLASRCELTMFDEPTTGMDAAVRNDFYRALLKDYLAHPRTFLISSHHLDEIEDLLEDILLIEDGEKVLQLPMDDLKEYAVGLTGRTEIVRQWAMNKEVLYTQEIDLNSTYVVIKNGYFEVENAKRLGINVSPVSSSDVCVYLTNKKKGGIDDVFK
ncbi:ABC transporter ATP-binding protein [Virgibacillus sp. C22-A2]|uniref:ABC transporter ATP-binding protein n=1 Tax=Virgibacillus tibetensis TaxID=3042313 RepID=A0ABU6KJH4_9BACI|nr:ABC transporter ATP-binding protein [Virgibacillus sp. C22-A2]